ncbi:hypothetical protein QTG54_003677 [Skeletonema marinoi]|uniref:GH16 domain-containing protein n=1 Tax=Skeletonema marinoi TaxID=267567 RepID=A0AAD9DHH3_9STRA|nr:hypothetical protein QTG54_003677 [Skeletonema marinoi]
MVTRGNQAFRWRIQFRARTAGCTARGTWPALWALPEEWVYGGWPNSGEIDVMEAVGYEENKFHGSVHTGAYNHGIGTQKTASVIKSNRTGTSLRLTGKRTRLCLLSMEKCISRLLRRLGGNWGAVQGVDAAAFEGDGQYMELDWVRVYSN